MYLSTAASRGISVAPIRWRGNSGTVNSRIPFVGPAGELLNAALHAAGIDRDQVYLTNVVKHFKWERVGTSPRRIHKKPNAAEIAACRLWLDAEIEHVQPRVIACLGATAAQALLGRSFRGATGYSFPPPAADQVWDGTRLIGEASRCPFDSGGVRRQLRQILGDMDAVPTKVEILDRFLLLARAEDDRQWGFLTALLLQ